MNDDLISRVAELAIAGANPLRRNQYKVPLARALVKQALNSLRLRNSA
jgi:CO/xanthine dehydrogenase FAD-binding subunit